MLSGSEKVARNKSFVVAFVTFKFKFAHEGNKSLKFYAT